VRLGVISDTHGYLDPLVWTLYEGVDLILHAGDVGDPAILDDLSHLAPVVAVRGNVDTEGRLAALPESVLLQVAGVSIYMTHILQPDSEHNGDDGRGDPLPPGTRVALFGHSHLPVLRESERRGGVLWFNPASAGRKRFRNPRLTGLLTIDDDGLRAEHLPLDESA
jgi:putative phosphoesterase